MQDFAIEWTDETLYEKYGLTNTEIALIESMIRPMDLGDE
jgi:site-specific DNA-methyltransferase (adenine-specific)